MKLHRVVGVGIIFLCASAALAQQPKSKNVPLPRTTVPASPPATVQSLPPVTHFTPPSLTAPQVTPELWVYSQELKRHDDPAQAVRRKAEAKADQRLGRLAALKWYGQSNARPDASPIPLMGAYSPGWIGNGWQRYDWASFGASASLLRVETIGIVR
jgi:hypothetical protein